MNSEYKPKEFLSYGKQWIDEDDAKAVLEVLKGDFLTQGPAVPEFEEALRAVTGAKYCVAVANGTAALHLAVAALGLEGGSGITSPLTFAASANCMAYNGLRPDFADIDPETGCMSAAALEARVSPNTKLVVPVHFAGRPADMAGISAVARKRGLRIIEDAAHALGSVHADGASVGACSSSDMAIFSFHPVKTITTGEGGAVTTNDRGLYDRLCLLRTHGITKDPALMAANPGPWYYEMQELGFNYRLTDIQAALGTSQLRKLDAFAERRRAIAARYAKALAGMPWLEVPPTDSGCVSTLHLYVARIDFKAIGKSRAQVMAELKAAGVGTQVHYIPVHLQPYYRRRYGFKPGDFPASEAFYESALSIPLYPKMCDDDVDYVASCIRNLAR